METTQEQALRNEQSWKNQALFKRYASVDGAPKKQIVTAVHPVFLSPLVDQLMGFVQVYAIQMLHQLFTSYVAIDEIDLEDIAVKNDWDIWPRWITSPFIREIRKG